MPKKKLSKADRGGSMEKSRGNKSKNCPGKEKERRCEKGSKIVQAAAERAKEAG